MKNIHIEEIIRKVNKSQFRLTSIPAELASGWPCIQVIENTPCVTIPYYYRKIVDEKVALFPLYCAVTVPLGNPDRVIDFTIFKHQRDWSEFNYNCPSGYFKHDAIAKITRSQYKKLCERLFSCYDKLIACMLANCEYHDNGEFSKLFTILMEPGHYEQYLKINKQFYTHFCKL